MRWDCGKRGCYNVKHRPKIEEFAECFPGKISMGDVDGLVEINGHFLLLEWKSVSKDLGYGQRKTYEQITASSPVVVMVVTGNPETMVVEKYSIFRKGKQGGDIPASLDDVKARIKSWSDWAKGVQAA